MSLLIRQQRDVLCNAVEIGVQQRKMGLPDSERIEADYLLHILMKMCMFSREHVKGEKKRLPKWGHGLTSEEHRTKYQPSFERNVDKIWRTSDCSQGWA